ncbi:MAG: Asp-tRNA(Asn)/Glu-tRNA(Gln) amidotransferase subunit GatC [Bacteroidota bacterium]|jgi:aspartyl-tRNA(Asn)/glutamyl-tRNA(Gln) amidotransferase subunit C
MEVNNALIDNLAKLARLKIQPSEKEMLRKDMEKMIGFIEQLQNLNTAGVDPLLHMTTEIDRLREDEVVSSISREDALKNAAKKDLQFFHVPKVIKK